MILDPFNDTGTKAAMIQTTVNSEYHRQCYTCVKESLSGAYVGGGQRIPL